MLTYDQIENAAFDIAKHFPVKKISYFGSYANGTATENSDLDMLVEFNEPIVSLLLIIDMKYRFEETLGVVTDIIHAPIPENSIIRPDKVVCVYDAA